MLWSRSHQIALSTSEQFGGRIAKEGLLASHRVVFSRIDASPTSSRKVSTSVCPICLGAGFRLRGGTA